MEEQEQEQMQGQADESWDRRVDKMEDETVKDRWVQDRMVHDRWVEDKVAVVGKVEEEVEGVEVGVQGRMQ